LYKKVQGEKLKTISNRLLACRFICKAY